MIRGTTPKHTFNIPITADDVSAARVVYAQFGRDKIIKTGADLALTGNQIECVLTQEDTMSFSCKYPVEVQVRILTTAGLVMASDIMTINVERCLDSEVLA